MKRCFAVVALATASLIACEALPAVACGAPDALVDHPRRIVVPGVRVGPLHVTTGMWMGQPNAQLGWDRPEQMSKFIISRADHFESPLTVTGRRCSDARPLRFADHQPWPADASLSIGDIERLTTLSRVVDPMPSSITSTAETVYGGYFIFIAPGKWLVEVKDRDRLVGSAVIEVIAAQTKR